MTKVLLRFTVIAIVFALNGCGGDSSVDNGNAATGGGTGGSTDNRPPTIGGIPPTRVMPETLYSFTPTANDPDGDVLKFAIIGLPVWANFDPADGRLWGVPSSSDLGGYVGINISVSDDVEQAILPSFVITVNSLVNQAPTIGGNPPDQVAVGGFYSFSPTANDPDGDTLIFTMTGQPAWAEFDPASGRLSGAPGLADVGTDSGIEINVTDGNDSATLPLFEITVIPQGLGTTTLSWTAPTENEDGTQLTDLAGFKVYLGTSANTLVIFETINDPAISTYQVKNLTPGAWFFAMTAYNESGIESIKSNVASWTYQP